MLEKGKLLLKTDSQRLTELMDSIRKLNSGPSIQDQYLVVQS